MGKCDFDANSCSVECKKYPICSYYSVQNQLNNIQSQLNFFYKTIGQILHSNEENDKKIALIEEGLYKFGYDFYESQKEKL